MNAVVDPVLEAPFVEHAGGCSEVGREKWCCCWNLGSPQDPPKSKKVDFQVAPITLLMVL